MSYFENVYLKRLNRDGKTRQERIKTKKEKEFDKLFLKKSEYQSLIYQVDEEEEHIVCSLQPNKWNENELISNLLVPTNVRPLQTGAILRIFQKIKDVEYDKIWLIIMCEENITKGYFCYKLICLDSEINITNEYGDTLYNIPVKFINASAALVNDLFSFTAKNKGYREPEHEIRLVTKSFPFLIKGLYFEYNKKGFEIEGIDDISITDVAYVSIKEGLIKDVEPRESESIIVNEDENFFLQNR